MKNTNTLVKDTVVKISALTKLDEEMLLEKGTNEDGWLKSNDFGIACEAKSWQGFEECLSVKGILKSVASHFDCGAVETRFVAIVLLDYFRLDYELVDDGRGILQVVAA